MSLPISTTGFDFGDYTGLAFHAGTFYPCWADNSNSTGDNPAGTLNTFDIYTAAVAVTEAAPVRLLNPRFVGSAFVASVQTVNGKTYFLESTPSLADRMWSPADSITGDGTLRDLVDTNAVIPRGFYRVRVQ